MSADRDTPEGANAGTPSGEVPMEARLSALEIGAAFSAVWPENTRRCLIAVDSAGVIVFANPAFLTATGYAGEDVVGRDLLSLLAPPSERDLGRFRLHQALSGEDFVHFVTPTLTRDGSFLNLAWTSERMTVGGVPLLFAVGDVVGPDDVAVSRLRAEGDALRRMIRATPTSVAMLDRDMRYLACSRRWIEEYKLDESQVIGRSHYDVFPEIPERWREIHRRCLAGVGTRSDDDRFDRADGTTQYLRWAIEPWFSADGTVGGLILFTEDVTGKRALEQRLLTAQRIARLGSCEFDLRTGQGWWSEELARLLGVNPEEEARLTLWLDAVHPDDRGRVLARALDVDGAPANYQDRYRIVRRDGAVRWMQVYAAVDRDTSGEASRVRGTVQDVTEQEEQRRAVVEALEARAASEARFRRLFEGALEGIYRTSASGVALDVNPAFARLLGYDDPAQIIGRDVAEMYVDPADRARWIAAVGQADHVRDLELWLRSRTGEPRLVQVNARVVRDADGAITAFEGFAHDVTWARATQRALRFLSTESVGIHGAQFFERAALEITELVGSDAAGFAAFHDGERRTIRTRGWVVRGQVAPLLCYEVAPTPCARVIRGEAVVEAEGVCTRYPDDLDLVQLHAESYIGVPVVSSKGEVLGPLFSISQHPAREPERVVELLQLFAARCAAEVEREQAEALRATMLVELHQRRKLESLGTLAGGIAHDFNNLLAAMSLHLELARDRATEDAVLRECLDDVAAGANRARDLVRQILTFSRRQPPLRRAVDLGAVAREAYALLRVSAPPGVVVSLDTPDDLPPVLADSGQVLQVLTNLLTNAWQAIGAGPGRIHVSVSALELPVARSDRQPAGRYVRVAVQDDGPGVPSAVRPRIFEPFFTTKEVGSGTGLGLAVVHGIVEEHGGWVEVSEVAPRGARFTVWLPAIAPPVDFPATAVAAPGVPSMSPPKGRILLVEDDERVLRGAVALVLRLGYHVEGFQSPMDALAALQENGERFDGMLTDLNMPGMDGLALARAARRIQPDLRVVLTSGNRSYSDDDLVVSGVDVELPKPFSSAELGAALARVVAAADRAGGPRGAGASS